LSATARDDWAEAHGVDLSVGRGFVATLGSVTVSADGLARAVAYTGGDEGRLTMAGDIAATSGGNAHGLLIDAGHDFRADVQAVSVTGSGGAVRGIDITMGDRGMVRQAGDISVLGHSASSLVRGVVMEGGDDIDVSLGAIGVEGLKEAFALQVNAGDGGTLTQTGTILAEATDVGAA